MRLQSCRLQSMTFSECTPLQAGRRSWGQAILLFVTVCAHVQCYSKCHCRPHKLRDCTGLPTAQTVQSMKLSKHAGLAADTERRLHVQQAHDRGGSTCSMAAL